MLAELFRDPEPNVRAHVVSQTGHPKVTEHHGPACRQFVSEALDDPHPSVVLEAAQALYRQLDHRDCQPQNEQLANRLLDAITPESPAMNVIVKRKLSINLDTSLSASANALMESVASKKPE